MKIGVIGTINRDSIRLADGSRKEGWGGILYNLVTLSSLVGEYADIYPICNVGKNHYTDVMRLLYRLPGIKINLIRKVAEKNNHCHLTYLDSENKREILKGGVPPLKYGDVRGLEDCKIILMNYISGKDIYLQSLQKLRHHYPGIIYIDIHSYTLGKRKNGARFIRRPLQWRKVFACADYLQMNRLELAIIARGINNENNVGDRLESDFEEMIDLAAQDQLNFESKVFIITDGSKGCHLFRHENRKWAGRFVHPAIDSETKSYAGRSLNATGCGDCFAAGFVAGLAANNDPVECAAAANSAGHARIMDKHKIYSILDIPV
ncbi:MAG: carbohydrate kinase family protein [Candidatus Zixiibacteriota bacterium]